MLDQLVRRAAGLTRSDGRAVLGITGLPGAGKSTLAGWLVDALGPRAVIVPMDGFHLANATLARLGRQGRKGAIDTFDGHGYLAALRRVRSELRHTVYLPGFDRSLEEPIAGRVAIDRGVRLAVTEGNYLLASAPPWADVRGELADVWYVELDDAVRRRRLVARHVRFGKTEAAARRWVHEVDDVNARLIEATRDTADLVVDMSLIETRGAAL